MNDYLSRAVEREISAAPAVRPALPSLFEPGPTSAIVTAGETESPIEGDPSANTPDEAKPRISPLPEPLAAVKTLWTDPAIGAPEQPRKGNAGAGKTSAALADTPLAPAATAALPAKQQPLPDAAAIESTGRPMAETPPKPLPAATEGIVGPTREAPPKSLQAATGVIVRPTGIPQPRPAHAAAAQQAVRPVSESPSTEVRAVPTIGERAATSPTAPPVRSAPGRSKPKSATPPTPAPLTKVVAPAYATIPRVSPAPSSPERARSADIAPSPRPVHITIGRIEVRAIHPPPEPARHPPAPAAPKISLEEYLKQRNGGRQ